LAAERSKIALYLARRHSFIVAVADQAAQAFVKLELEPRATVLFSPDDGCRETRELFERSRTAVLA
jgi:hypothetical protein